MKLKLAFLCPMILLILNSCTQQERKFPQGAWQVVSWKHLSGDTIESQFPGDYSGSGNIIVSETFFLSVGRFKKDTTYLRNYFAAKYTLDGNHFEATFLNLPNIEMVGHVGKQLLELQNDTLKLSYPCNDNWELSNSGYYVEKYVRLK